MNTYTHTSSHTDFVDPKINSAERWWSLRLRSFSLKVMQFLQFDKCDFKHHRYHSGSAARQLVMIIMWIPHPLISTDIHFFFCMAKITCSDHLPFLLKNGKGPTHKKHNCRHTWTSLRFDVLSAATHASTSRWHIQALPCDLQLFWFKSVVSSWLFQGHPVFFFKKCNHTPPVNFSLPTWTFFIGNPPPSLLASATGSAIGWHVPPDENNMFLLRRVVYPAITSTTIRNTETRKNMASPPSWKGTQQTCQTTQE